MKCFLSGLVLAGLLLAQTTTTALTGAQLAALSQAKANLRTAIAAYNQAVAAIAGPPTITACTGGSYTITTSVIVGTNLVSASKTSPCAAVNAVKP
jgi:hypothetical protein